MLPLAGTAVADGTPGVGSCDDFFCVGVKVPGQSGSEKARGSKGGAKGGTVKAPECTPAKKLEPQPPVGSEVWEGLDPAKGAVLYVRTCRNYTDSGASTMITETLLGGLGGPAAPVVNPAVLAEQALDKMLLRGPEIGITPKPVGKGVVGMPVYLWTKRSPETYGPNTASASADGVTVTATAKVSKIVWSMGDGETVICTTAGTPYKAEYGKKPSPDCGHRYGAPSSTTESGKFHVTATSTWTIDWTATSGPTGQLTEVRTSAVDITVAEVQVLN
ncbi:ATP/GTP-binding protein [Streptomyces sp. NPDC056524]|uniref:ATP/GTP-binding protein n=1 Tax=Streptomyces sp. NPDC056524 TaxID=3345851 RepID=UPI0036CC74A7